MSSPPSFQPALNRALARLEVRRPLDPATEAVLLAEAVRVEGGAAGDLACGLDLSPWRGCPGLAGELFQMLRGRREPQASRDGQVFTPWGLARHLAGLLEPAAGQRWLDPAAGAGIFLQAAVASGVSASSCHALEMDGAAADLGRSLLPDVHWRVGDALADWADLPAGWRGGWPRVILNPPYRNGVERRDEAWARRREELRRRFPSARGPFDLYVPFVERALDLLAPQGRLGLLLPIAWLASRFGRGLRGLLAERAWLLRLQHAPGARLFPRADFGILLLVLEPRGEAPAPALAVERLDRRLQVVERHLCAQDLVVRLAEEGWGPLLAPPNRRLLVAGTAPLGTRHEVRASLSTAEYYELAVRECDQGEPPAGWLRLLSSGALDPFHHRWRDEPVRFRGGTLRRPVVEAATLSRGRRAQVERHRVLLANLSRRLEAVAVEPGEALGVVNVMQILCDGREEALALAAWLNSGPVQEWTRCWHDPARLGSQLALGRSLVECLPGLPDGDDPRGLAARRELADLARAAAAQAPAGLLADGAGLELRSRLDQLVAAWMPPASDAADAGFSSPAHLGNERLGRA